MTNIATEEKKVSREDIEDRQERHARKLPTRVAFRLAGLYGLSPNSLRFPLSEREAIESGQVCVTLDAEADPAANIGMIDFERGTLTVRYGVQAVFPGLFELVTSGKYDPSLLNPVRGVATDECTLNEDHTGWRALGCLELLPGSLWAGAKGG